MCVFTTYEVSCTVKHLYAFLMLLQALESMQLKQEVTHIEEERIQVLNNIEELEQKIKDLDNQMEESVREVDGSAAYKLTPEHLNSWIVFVHSKAD